ncbi:MAG: TOBE domain-containing protein [Pseudomonadota bacterium]|nr:TOBE domain-containing protein [Pseudomonadota bacterium]
MRPESFGSTQTQASVELNTNVEAVEFLGHETLAYLSLPGAAQAHTDQPLIARLQGQFHRPGDDEAVFHISPDDLYFFTQTGRNILIEGTGDQ